MNMSFEIYVIGGLVLLIVLYALYMLFFRNNGSTLQSQHQEQQHQQQRYGQREQQRIQGHRWGPKEEDDPLPSTAFQDVMEVDHPPLKQGNHDEFVRHSGSVVAQAPPIPISREQISVTPVKRSTLSADVRDHIDAGNAKQNPVDDGAKLAGDQYIALQGFGKGGKRSSCYVQPCDTCSSAE